MPTRWVPALAVIGLCLTATSSDAATITVTTTDLGGGNYQNDYVVSGVAFDAFEGFTIFFDVATYSNLSGESTGNSDWFLQVLQPDPSIPPGADGLFDAVALAAGAAIDLPFSVMFHFDGSGLPGSQPFELTAFDDSGNFLGSRGSGSTLPAATGVPEPATLFLAAIGVAAAAFRRTRA